MYLESESANDLPTLHEIRIHFSEFIRNLIRNTPGNPQCLLQSLFIQGKGELLNFAGCGIYVKKVLTITYDYFFFHLFT